MGYPYIISENRLVRPFGYPVILVDEEYFRAAADEGASGGQFAAGGEDGVFGDASEAVDGKEDVAGIGLNLGFIPLPPDPATGADFEAVGVDDLAGRDFFGLGAAEGGEDVARFAQAEFDVAGHAAEVVGADGQDVFEGDSVAEVDDGVDAGDVAGFDGPGVEGFDRALEFVGVEAEFGEGVPPDGDGGVVFDAVGKVAAGGGEGGGERPSLAAVIFSRNQLPALGLLVGAALFYGGVPRPAWAGAIFDPLVHIGAWMSLVPVGFSADFRAMRQYWLGIVDMNVIKFIITPLLTYFFATLVVSDTVALNAVLITASTPTAIFSVIAVKMHRLNVHITMAAFVLTTAVYLLIVYPLEFLWMTGKLF